MQPRGKGQDQTKRTKWVSGYTGQLCHWILECVEKRLGFHQGILAADRDGKRCYEALVGENEDVELFGEGRTGDPEEDEDDDMTENPASEVPNRYCAATDASAAVSCTSVRWNSQALTRPRPQAETDEGAQPVLPSKPWPGRSRDGRFNRRKDVLGKRRDGWVKGTRSGVACVGEYCVCGVGLSPGGAAVARTFRRAKG